MEIIIINTKHPPETTTIVIEPQQALNQECFVGRDERCCIVLNDPMVSRIHGKIAYHQGNYYYTDLGSSNGSLLNNKIAQVNQNYPLKTLDTINLGNYLIWIRNIGSLSTQQTQATVLIPQEYMPLANVNPSKLTPWTQDELEVCCVRVTEETHDVKTFSFVADPPVLFTYKPGQFVTLKLQIQNKLVKRSYSISSSPSRPHTLDITVKRVLSPVEQPDAPPGLVSNWLHDNLMVGSKIKLSPPVGKFTNFAHPTPKLLLISAGSGITPMISMARWICDTASKVDITFIHSARSPRDIIFRQELELMATKYPNFKLAITITRSETGATWYGYTGRLNNSMVQAIAPDYQERSIYVCGSDPFMKSVKSLFQKLNFPMEHYYEESFGITKKVISASKLSESEITPQGNERDSFETHSLANISSTESLGYSDGWSKTQSASLQELANFFNTVTVSQNSNSHLLTAEGKEPITSYANNLNPGTSAVISPPQPSVVSPPVVKFVQSGKEIVCETEDSILEVAQAQGIELPYGCGMGICGQCKLPKLEGEVIYDDDVECESDQILTCVAKAKGTVVIDA